MDRPAPESVRWAPRVLQSRAGLTELPPGSWTRLRDHLEHILRAEKTECLFAPPSLAGICRKRVAGLWSEVADGTAW